MSTAAAKKPAAKRASATKTATAVAAVPTTAPKIGEYWPGQGGIYLGLARADDDNPQGHLVLCDVAPAARMTWADAIEYAKTQSADGHSDLRLPTRFEAALIYANGQKHVDQSAWHWTGTQYSRSSAWVQNFDDGFQNNAYKDYDYRVRLVRRFVL